MFYHKPNTTDVVSAVQMSRFPGILTHSQGFYWLVHYVAMGLSYRLPLNQL